MIILDTNVVSETLKVPYSDAVKRWFEAQAPDELWITTVTAAELLFGVYRLDEGRRRRELHEVIHAILLEDYAERSLTFDLLAADEYARLVARLRRAGTPTRTHDAQIAAIALVHGASVATRNTDHFAKFGVELIDPWAA